LQLCGGNATLASVFSLQTRQGRSATTQWSLTKTMQRVTNEPAKASVSSSPEAFTLIELLVVAGMLAVLAVTLAPALAKSGGRSGRITCFNNKRQVEAACALYSAEWNDWLTPNAPVGAVSPTGQPVGWCPGQENWSASIYNTAPDYYRTNVLGPYVGNVDVYKCPNDKLLSDNGERIRSISMNGAMCGDLPANVRFNIQSFMSGFRVYSKTADLTVPRPANTWVFCDESMFTLNDGYLQVALSLPGYPDVPAAYDVGGNCFSFADAHVEYREWVWPGTTSAGLRNCPYRYGVTTSSSSWGSSGADTDWVWLRQHSSAQ